MKKRKEVSDFILLLLSQKHNPIELLDNNLEVRPGQGNENNKQIAVFYL
jgi:hypothetical protein